MRKYIMQKYRAHLKNQHTEVGEERNKTDEFFKIDTYFGETGHKSYWVGYHINLNNTHENFVNGLALEVNWDGIHSKTMPKRMKDMIDHEFNYEYPNPLKEQYFKLKKKLSNAISFLNKNIKNVSNTDGNPLFSNEIKLRHLDMDQFRHLNHAQSFAFIQDTVMEYNINYLVNEINVLFWRQTKITDKYIYVNIWRIQQDENQPDMKIVYGSIDCRTSQDHEYKWDRRNGFVVKVLVPSKQNRAKL